MVVFFKSLQQGLEGFFAGLLQRNTSPSASKFAVLPNDLRFSRSDMCLYIPLLWDNKNNIYQLGNNYTSLDSLGPNYIIKSRACGLKDKKSILNLNEFKSLFFIFSAFFYNGPAGFL